MAIAKADMPAAALDATWAGAIRQRRKALLPRLGTAAPSGWAACAGWPATPC